MAVFTATEFTQYRDRSDPEISDTVTPRHYCPRLSRRRVFGRGDETAPPEDVLTPEQCDAVRAFLAFAAEFGSTGDRVLAQEHMGHYARRALGAVGEPVPTL